DASHQRRDRQERDAFVDTTFAAIGLPLLRVRWQRSYDCEQLAAQIRATARMPAPPRAQRAASTSTTGNTTPRPNPVPSQAQPERPQPAPQQHVCPGCHPELTADARFCPRCGTHLEAGEA
ncbi:DUF2726 domain-containing protein, partial [Candidatus Chloroploca asiatica]|uniref:DUF2726 domain-containing protein n=1 Tax=Candidatus Chloroploca asiatica TaxID=1506545 RepID=UPI001144B1D3